MGRVFFDTRKNVHALDAAYTVLERKNLCILEQ